MGKATDELFDEYKSLRSQGQTEIEAQRNLTYGVQVLSISSQLNLKQRFQTWEEELTLADLHLQERTNLSDIQSRLVFCPICESPNLFGLKNCQVCDASLITATAYETEEHTAEGDEVVRHKRLLSLVLHSMDGKNQFIFGPEMYMAGIRLGRLSSSLKLELNLSDLGAAELGVSRLHALLSYDSPNNTFYLTDLNSTNGTFVNGSKLPANTKRQINDGDELTFGRLKLRLGFREYLE